MLAKGVLGSHWLFLFVNAQFYQNNKAQQSSLSHDINIALSI